MAVTDPVEALAAAVSDGTLPPGGPLLVACSGGRDSMALLHALHAAGRWTLHVATVDHGLHLASCMQAEWVVARAVAQGFEACRLVVDPERVRQGDGPEAAARAERYRVLRRHAWAVGAARIVTAHTADDQAETVLMRLGEGTGLRGLGGMRPLRDELARPWLPVSRAAVAAYAEAAGVEWVSDPSNGDERFRRNALRARVGSGMGAVFGDDWSRRVARSARQAQGALALLDWCLGPAGLRLVDERVDAIEIDRAALDRLPSAAGDAVLAHALQRAAERWAPAVGRRIALHVPRLRAGRIIGLPGGLEAHAAAAVLRIAPRAPRAMPAPPVVVPGPGRYTWGAWRVVIEALPALPAEPAGDFVAQEAAPMPWTIRAAAPGDRFRPLGAPGQKPVTRSWRDAGVLRERRGGLPLVVAAGEIVWVAGLRAGECARARRGEPVFAVRLEEGAVTGAEPTTSA